VYLILVIDSSIVNYGRYQIGKFIKIYYKLRLKFYFFINQNKYKINIIWTLTVPDYSKII